MQNDAWQVQTYEQNAIIKRSDDISKSNTCSPGFKVI